MKARALVLALWSTSLVLASACGGGRSPQADAPEGPGPAESGEWPSGTRAVVVDGAPALGSVYLIGESGDRSGGVSVRAIRPGAAFLHPAFNPDLMIPPFRPDPPPLGDDPDDCDALEHIREVGRFMDATREYAAATASSVEGCAARITDLVEETRARVRAEDVEPLAYICPASPSGRAPDLSDGLGSYFGCRSCTEALSGLTRRLDALQRHGAMCSQLRDDLNEIRDRVERELAAGELSGFSVCLAGSFSLLDYIDDEARRLAAQARNAESGVRSTLEGEECCPSTLEESCASCDDPLPLREAGRAPPAVQDVAPGPVLDEVVDTLRSAAGRSNDPDAAEALSDLAERMGETPRGLVRRVTYPAPLAAPEHMIAVRRPTSDARPLVLILSAVPSDSLPRPTARDRARWFEATDAWRAMLARDTANPVR